MKNGSKRLLNDLGFSHHYLTPVIIVLVVTLIGIRVLTASHAATNFTQTSGRPFASNSPWNSSVIATPTIDKNNSAIVTALIVIQKNNYRGGVADLYQFGIPIWNGNSTNPLRLITCIKYGGGVCVSKAGVTYTEQR